MFYYLDGNIALMGQGFAVVDVNGIGFHVYTSDNTLANLNLGSKAKLYTYPVIREDCFDLYGFFSLEEKHCFEMLLSVSGVGPKAAIAILSCNTPEGLSLAILSGNEGAITSAPGVGKKIAQRVILELKDKMNKSGDVIMPGVSTGIAASKENNSKLSDATAALAVLGYSSNEIAQALKGIDLNALSIEDIIRTALKSMAKQ